MILPTLEKKMKLINLSLLLCAAFYISGCTTMADAIAARGTGDQKSYNQTKDEIWPFVVEAVPAVGLELVTENEASGMLLAQRGITALSYGENVAIFIDDKEGGQCSVEVVSKKAMETNVFAPNWSNAIFKYFDKK